MREAKLIAVLGATGTQGGGLARTILADPDGGFAVRAVTRKTDSDKARELQAQGAEVVAADLDDRESLERAFAGAYGAFGVTNFWEHFDPDRELRQARNIAEAARAAGLRHVVWSTLEDTRKDVGLEDDRMPTLLGRFKVPHFDAKGEANAYFTELDVPTTFLYVSFYWDNLVYFGLGPKRGPDGKLALTFPMGDRKLAGIAAEDIGKAVYGIFKQGEAAVGQRIGIAGGQLTGEEMARSLAGALGQDVSYRPVTVEQFRGFGFPGAEDMGNMFQYYQEFEDQLGSLRDVSRTRALNPELQSFDAWLDRNKERIPVD